MQSSSLSATWTTQQQFWCYVDQQGQIVATDITGNRIIGVTMEKYNQIESAANEALSKAEGYYKILEENGLVKKQLTPEEQIAALAEQVRVLTELVTAQANKEPKNESGANSVDGRRYIASKQPAAAKDPAGAANGGPIPGQ